MIAFLATLILMSALMFSLLCFFMIVQPSRILVILVYLFGKQESWHQGRLDIDGEERIYRAIRRIEKIVLIALFGWCFFCGAILALLELMM